MSRGYLRALSAPAGRVTTMSGWMWGALGLVVGAGLAVLVVRLVDAARSASVVAERDLLRERVLDLETSLPRTWRPPPCWRP